MIAGTGSGCGKTTVTCALLSALHRRKINVSAFKCGPDYIDPMFYREILQTPSHNLDSFFCDKNMLCHILEKFSNDTDIAVIEGVMGYYDGAEGSPHQISEMTDTPVILVINCRGMKESIGAVMQGFLRFRQPNHIAGFIFNQLPEQLIPFAKQLCESLSTTYFGCLPSHSNTLESRYLGLVTASEILNIHEKMNALGVLAEQYLYIDNILHIPCASIPKHIVPLVPKLRSHPVIAVAKDKAFCFQYEENLSILREIGCELRFFSPQSDQHIPQADGLILCGGYPELYADQLSSNQTMRNDIKNAILNHMPVIAECGGFMYLHSYLQTDSGRKYPLAGVIEGTVFRSEKLVRFGYASLNAEHESMLFDVGNSSKIHEFHYWESTNSGDCLTALKPDGRTWKCCHINDTLYAGFPHLYFYSDIRIALRFASACAKFGGKDESYSAD